MIENHSKSITTDLSQAVKEVIKTSYIIIITISYYYQILSHDGFVNDFIKQQTAMNLELFEKINKLQQKQVIIIIQAISWLSQTSKESTGI